MTDQIIIYEFIYQDFDAVQIEFHSINHLEEFLLNNECFARAIGYYDSADQKEAGFSGNLKALIRLDGDLTYIPFGNFQELKIFLNKGWTFAPAT